MGAQNMFRMAGWLSALALWLFSFSPGFAAAPDGSAPWPSTLECPGHRALPLPETQLLAHANRIAAEADTIILPAGTSARLDFDQLVPSDKALRVFEVYDPLSGSNRWGNERDILAITHVPPTSDAVPDRTRIQVEIPSDAYPLWPRRHFVILACDSKHQVTSWGLVNARVSNLWLARAICFLVALAAYLLSTYAIRVSRKQKHELADAYPAIFKAPQLQGFDWLNPIHLTANAFNQASVQKLQVIVFSFLVGSLVLYLVLTTGTLTELSSTVVQLLGISGVGAAAAQATSTERGRLGFDNWAWLVQRGVISLAVGPGPCWRDLVMTNREFDIYKLQTIIFSAGVVCDMVVSGASNLANFVIPGTTLGILGLSQVVYIGGILVRPPAIGDLDDALTDLRNAEQKAITAKVQKTDTDADGNLINSTKFTGTDYAVNAERQYDLKAKKVKVMIESALEVKADENQLKLDATSKREEEP